MLKERVALFRSDNSVGLKTGDAVFSQKIQFEMTKIKEPIDLKGIFNS